MAGRSQDCPDIQKISGASKSKSVEPIAIEGSLRQNPESGALHIIPEEDDSAYVLFEEITPGKKVSLIERVSKTCLGIDGLAEIVKADDIGFDKEYFINNSREYSYLCR